MNFYAASVALLWTTAMRMANPPQEPQLELDRFTDRSKYIDHVARHRTVVRAWRRCNQRSATCSYVGIPPGRALKLREKRPLDHSHGFDPRG
jgi:hypothetical protein